MPQAPALSTTRGNRSAVLEHLMRWPKSLIAWIALAAAAGLKISCGSTEMAPAARAPCVEQCAAEFRQCRTATPAANRYAACNSSNDACLRTCG
jgi:hypothetical protein